MWELMQNEKEEKDNLLYLPKTLELANSLFLAFIKNNNLVGLKLAILFSGARGQIEYSKNNKALFKVDTLCDLLQVSKRQLSSHLKKITKVQFDYVNQEGGAGRTTPIHSYEYINRNKDLIIEISSKAKELFTELGKGGYSFSQASATHLMSLKHKHSIRMQLLLEQIANFDKDVAKRKHYTLEQLNKYFGVNYRNYTDFETKILKPVQNEINSTNKLGFIYQLNDDEIKGTGRPRIKNVTIDLVEKYAVQGKLL